MEKNLNIVITTAPFGNGHKMVANALKNAFIKKGYNNIKVVDIFTESHPKITDGIKKAYIKSYDYKYAYSFFYYGVNKIADNEKIIRPYTKFGTNSLNKLIKEFEPDIIINTYPLSFVKGTKYKAEKSVSIPIFNVITDFCVHKLWISEEIDKFYIATQELQEELEKMNIPIEKTVVSGIPIRDSFEKSLNTNYLYKKYNFNRNKKTILISAGAFGVLKDIKNICKKLCSYSNLQVAVVCGNNKELKKELDSLCIKNLKAFGFIENIHELYNISNCMITKPGGITLSEALAVQIPLILFNPIPGQEKENALFFKEKGAAVIAKNKDEIITNILHLCTNDNESNKMKENMKKIYNKYSTYTIVDDVLLSVEGF